MFVRTQDHAAAVAAVAAVRTSSWHVRFASETRRAGAAIASFGVNFDVINKHANGVKSGR